MKVESSDEKVTFTWTDYDFKQDLKEIFSRCLMCDSNGSYDSRIDSLNSYINLVIKTVLAKEREE